MIGVYTLSEAVIKVILPMAIWLVAIIIGGLLLFKKEDLHCPRCGCTTYYETENLHVCQHCGYTVKKKVYWV